MKVDEILRGPPSAYAGIGSRLTPGDVLYLMEQIAAFLACFGHRLRSGCAPGADQAFERGSGGRYELYLPWPEFERRPTSIVQLVRPSAFAYEIAARHHPAWIRLQRGAQALQARNSHQILGADCESPSRFVLCWTPDGATTVTSSRTGGTGQALRIADAYGVPVWNLQRADHRAEWEAVL